LEGYLTAWFDIVLSGVFHAAILFLVAAGLQLVFGVQKILNLACGSFYALGAYFGISAVSAMSASGISIIYFFPVLIASGLLIGLVGLPAERLLRTIYRREESHQLLLTFGLLLMLQDAIRFIWGAAPRTMENAYLAYGTIVAAGVQVPVYNLLVIVASLMLAAGLGLFLQRTPLGRTIRATAENRDMAEGLGANADKIFAVVFTLGCMLGTIGGALVVPASAASLDMAVDLIVEAFAVVVIGGLGSMRGAFAGALIAGLVRAVTISKFPEAEVLSIYLIVIVLLIFRPQGLLGKAVP
jgi:branched-chain amino acid transport system permease protein